MRLSLSQAATLLGKSERQLRYLVKTGQIPATKADGKWSIDEADLPLTASQRSAIDARAEAARRAFEGALPPTDKPDQPDAGRERVYTVTKLEAFRQGQALYRDARALLADDPACGLLFAALDHLTRGCHLFHADDKARAFALARAQASAALTHLLLGDAHPDGRRRLAERLEAEVLPRIAGLVASCERRARRRRPEHFGALQQTLAEAAAR